jgi:inosine-uridine nucleoside N-ribohydrolase
MAIAYALSSKEIELLGVISTQNNIRCGVNSVDIFHEEAKKVMQLAGASVPTFKGASIPLGLSLKPEISEGTSFIIKTINENYKRTPEKILVASTGPATDIANVCLIDPEIKNKASFAWLGGYKHFLLKKFWDRKEVNFRGDIVAANLISNLGIDLTIIPTLGTSHVLFMNTKILQKRFRIKNNNLLNYLAELIDWNWQRLHLNKKIFNPFLNAWVFCDLAVIAFAKSLGIKKVCRFGQKGTIVRSISRGKIIKDFYRCVLQDRLS